MEDSSTDPENEERRAPSGGPAADSDQDITVEDGQDKTHKAVRKQDDPAAFSCDDVAGDDSAVGHEVAPLRGTSGANDIGYYAHLHPDEKDLADNVASDVRRVPSALQRRHGGGGQGASAYEDITASQDSDAARDADGSAAEREGPSAEASLKPQRRADATTAQTTALARQPCHGTQVDAEVDVPVAADNHCEVREAGVVKGPAASASVSGVASHAARPGEVGTAAAVPAAAPPRRSLLPQAALGTAEVTVTLLPMQALTRITVPVHNPNLCRPPPAFNSTNVLDGGVAGNPVAAEDGSNAVSSYWVLVAKELFEVLAGHLGVHPESFQIFHQHKRLHFMGTLFLDCDVTSSSQSSEVGAAAVAENNRAEPLWVSVTFPSPDAAATAAAAAGAGAVHQPPFPSVAHGAEDEAEEAEASLAGVPAHLAALEPNDYVARCIRVRRRKVQIPPRTLVEGRRQGYSYDEVIQQMQSAHDAAVQREEEGDKGGQDATTLAGGSNFAIVAVVQDSPAPPTKPFLGGYRDKRLSGRVLLHAATQLYHRDLDYSPFAKTGGGAAVAAAATDRTSRQTQTFGISRSCQTHREACAQTPRVDLLLDTSHDFVIVARPYFTAAALQALQNEMAVVVQKLYRQWKARRVRAELEAAEEARQHRAGARQRREEALHAAVEDAAQLRRDDPRSAVDFERVKNDVIAWRAEEAARIQRDTSLSSADARAALLAITKKELQLLQQLDQRRREVGKTREEAAFVHNLDRMAAPKQWGTVHVTTPETERARELRDLYAQLVFTGGSVGAAGGVPSRSTRGGNGEVVRAFSTRMVSSTKTETTTASSSPDYGASTSAVEAPRNMSSVNAVAGAATSAVNDDGLSSATAARLDILLRVKWTVREFQAASVLARELGELIDREADLLHRGRKDSSLCGLRKRVQALFAQFIEDPAYNPGVKDFVQTARGRARVKAVEAEKTQQLLSASRRSPA